MPPINPILKTIRTDAEIQAAIMECVSYCGAWDHPASEAAEFGARLMQHRGWSPQDAEVVFNGAVNFLCPPPQNPPKRRGA